MKEKTNGRMRIELKIDKMIKGKSKFCNLIFQKIVENFGIPKIQNPENSRKIQKIQKKFNLRILQKILLLL